MPKLPAGTLMDETGLYPILPVTRTSSAQPKMGALKRGPPTKAAATRPSSPKRPKTTL